MSIQLIDSIPEDRFLKTNGLSTDKNNVGHFKGWETGKCMMFLYKKESPILKIQLKNSLVFINSDQEGKVQTRYEQLRNITKHTS